MLKLFNSIDGKTATIKLIKKQSVSLYLCGPTVYDHLHIGNYRPVVSVDILIRYFRFIKKIKVHYYHNITDLDDKIIARAQLLHQPLADYIVPYRTEYLQHCQKLNIIFPTKLLSVLDNIAKIIRFIIILHDKHFLNEKPDGWYFNANKIPEYGQLSHQIIQKTTTAQADFAIWKKTTDVSFVSPLGDGRPGWHTECAALIYFYHHQQTLDFHAGGVDLKFPHHENELIQYQAATNRSLANVWFHCGQIMLDGIKMSKTEQNVILMKDLLKTYKPVQIRCLYLMTHFQKPFNFSFDVMHQVQIFLTRWQHTLAQCYFVNFAQQRNLVQYRLTPSKWTFLAKFKPTIANNLNTPDAITIIDQALKMLGKNVQLVTKQQKNLLKQIIHCLWFLGLEEIIPFYSKPEQKQILLWQKYQSLKKYAAADKIRQQFMQKEKY